MCKLESNTTVQLRNMDCLEYWVNTPPPLYLLADNHPIILFGRGTAFSIHDEEKIFYYWPYQFSYSFFFSSLSSPSLSLLKWNTKPVPCNWKFSVTFSFTFHTRHRWHALYLIKHFFIFLKFVCFVNYKKIITIKL